MENGATTKGRGILSPRDSPPNASSSSSSNSSGNNGVFPAPAVPLTPKSIPRPADLNPFPTTFIQADSSSFKQVVQMLTGSAKQAVAVANPPPATVPKNTISAAVKATGPKKPAFKLYERRSCTKNLKMISPLIPAFAGAASFSPRKPQEILSPSILDFPSLALSPVTPLISDPFGRSPEPGSAEAVKAEERAIADKGFYLHPSPRTTPANGERPRLLPLFPVTSPRVSSSSSP
ncbi:hypothetical protein AXF42_Ash007365 [Apostasia shenzhenica]|uniref:VQ domain-containing protein n=1 Tax=Apostasia shenzhenica TaxID=1088818 RepID=A0A2I0BA24_9ASPA|nr:hypothetical protein AXF42_Ash007365 [Apostasia shenzhenica]